MRKVISRLCFTLGFLLLASALGLTLYNLWDAERASKASLDVVDKIETELQKEGITIGELPEQAEEQGENAALAEHEKALYVLYPEMEMPSVLIDGYRYIGVLEIPDLGLRLPVMQEWDYSRLKIAPCLYEGSAYQRNMVIAGHNYAKHFSQLKWVPNGTEIIFTDMNGNVFPYTIAWTEELNPDQVEEMISKDVDQWDMTLFTCTTGGGSRYTIRCILQ